MQVRESLKESASLVNSIITEDPEQTDAMMDAEAAKAVQADSKIHACKKRLTRFRATINVSKRNGRTGAEAGSKCTPKVLAKTKPEQKNSGKEPSVEEDQAKEATLKREAIYEQKDSGEEPSIKVKQAKEAAIRKTALKEATNKNLLEEGLLKKGPLECSSEKGLLETQEMCPPDQACQQDLEIRPTTEPGKEPPHGCNDDL